MQQMHNLIILDESGSMSSIKKPILEGFNELVQNIRGIEKQFPDQQHLVTFLTFNSLGVRTIHFAEPAASLNPLNESNYQPDAMTPLYDAMGQAMARLERHLEGNSEYKVLVTILTDGAENSSTEYTGDMIREKVDTLKDKGWTFTYMGTDHDVQQSAQKINITNVYQFTKSEVGLKSMFLKEAGARHRFADKVSKREVFKDDDFFKTDDE